LVYGIEVLKAALNILDSKEKAVICAAVCGFFFMEKIKKTIINVIIIY